MPAYRNNDFAVGNSGGGAPPGNENAKGAGAPVGNTNAATHHGYCDPLKHFDRLDERAQDFVESLYREYAAYHRIGVDDVDSHIVAHRDFESEQAVRDGFKELVAMTDLRSRTGSAFFPDGFVVEEPVDGSLDDIPSDSSPWYVLVDDLDRDAETGEVVSFTKRKVNPSVTAGHRLSTKRRTLEKELGLIENERHISVL